MHVEVMTAIGSRGEREPIEVILGRRHVVVDVILDRWTGKDYRYFKLLGRDGAVYILRLDEKAEAWEMTLFDRMSQTSALQAGRAPSGTAIPAHA